MIMRVRLKGLGMGRRLRLFRLRFVVEISYNSLLFMAQQVVDRARSIVPVRTGDLKRSIRVEEDEQISEIFIIAGNEKVNYAAAVEFGTSHGNKAQPYIRPALDSVRGGSISAILNRVRVRLGVLVDLLRGT